MPTIKGEETTYRYQTIFPIQFEDGLRVANFSNMATMTPTDEVREALIEAKVVELTAEERSQLKTKIASYFGRPEEL